ncbi:IS66 family transposase [Dehalobacterium formicoaceticum]|uniref:IS66 family transposase n=1 Tax=Dehalobacterium formicoaceticum TaxID=51515 RepID=UPI000B7D072E|nr:IS66 family transposase [Dehalobacterium formicoaceticum]
MENITESDANHPQTDEHIQSLKDKISVQEHQIEELSAKLKWYEEQFLLSQKRRFGASSEKTNPDQLSFFDEAEQEADPKASEPTVEEITYKRRKTKGKNDKMLDDLPVETVEYPLSDEAQTCPQCGEHLHQMSKEIRKEIKVIPAQVKVVKHVRHVYTCRNCEKNDISTPVITAPMPAPVLPGSFVSPSLMAFVMDRKYTLAVPLYRQEQQFKHFGIDLSRQTLANWMIHGANDWLVHLYNRMHTKLIGHEILHADETILQVLREEGRTAANKSYMWLYATGHTDVPIYLYDYRTTRASKHPQNMLDGFNGYLHTDGYIGYNGIPGVKPVGCFAHARRYFSDALKALPKGSDQTSSVAKEGLDYCNQLFHLEQGFKDLDADERYDKRLEQSKPVLDVFEAWLRTKKRQVLPKSALGKAIDYSLKQWDKLCAFLLDGRLEISNNRAERAIKPFVIGRKNFLFSNTPKGATASAIIYSMIETAKANHLSPFHYLTYLFEKLPNIDLGNMAQLDALLPWSDTLPESCKVSSNN